MEPVGLLGLLLEFNEEVLTALWMMQQYCITKKLTPAWNLHLWSSWQDLQAAFLVGVSSL